MPEPVRPLPSQPSLEQQKKLARELLRSYRAGHPEAQARVRRQLPDKQHITLTDTQFVLAREYGFASWADLKAGIAAAAAGELSAAVHESFGRAFQAGDADAVRTLLDAYPAARQLINAPIFAFGSTPLLQVVGSDNVALVDVLLDFGADPNRRSDWWAGGWHPLHSASGKVAERLMAAGALPDACAAAHLGRVQLLQELLDADPDRVHERGGDGQTPLHFATGRDVIDLLLERGANVDARDVDHRATPAQWMLDRRRGAGRFALAGYLVERGASADIFLASALGLTERLRTLLSADASLLDLRTGQGEYGEQPPSSFHIYTWTIGQNLSPMQVAAQFEQRTALDVLRSFASDRQRLLAACLAGDEAGAKQLLSARPQLVAELGVEEQRVLPDAGCAANAVAVRLMLELGFDPAATGSNGGTVLHWAAWEGAVDCVRTALQYPAVLALIESPDPTYGSTPLGWCCHGSLNCGSPAADHVAVARLLLEAGARPVEDAQDLPQAMQDLMRNWEAG